MEDRVTEKKDNLLLEAQNLEIEGKDPVKAIKKYKEAYNLGAKKEASHRLVNFYFNHAILYKKENFLNDLYVWGINFYPYNPKYIIDIFVHIWITCHSENWKNKIEQFIADKSKSNEYAKEKLNYIMEKLK